MECGSDLWTADALEQCALRWWASRNSKATNSRGRTQKENAGRERVLPSRSFLRGSETTCGGRQVGDGAGGDGFTYLVALQGAPGEDGNLGLAGGKLLGLRHLDRAMIDQVDGV